MPQIVVLRPRVVADFAGPGNRVERPDELAAPRVERLDAAADAVLGAGKARDDEPIEIERRARDREPVLPALGLHRPLDFAGLLIERDELAVELTDEHLAVA